MNFRTSEIYVQRRTRRRLHMAAVGCTADELADTIINAHIEKNFPAIIIAESQIAKIERELAKELGQTNGEHDSERG